MSRKNPSKYPVLTKHKVRKSYAEKKMTQHRKIINRFSKKGSR